MRVLWVLAAMAAVLLVGCQAPPLLVTPDFTTILVRPNGTATEREARVVYTLGARADVAVDVIGPDGKEYPLRERATRAPDDYEVRFDGTVPVGDGERRVLADGMYQLRIVAEGPAGRREERALGVVIADADTTPVEVLDLQLDLSVLTPNGDGEDDEVRISYRLTKDAEATVYATDERGNYHAIDPWRERRAVLHSHPWDGTTGGRIAGGRLLSDGKYEIHVEARDPAGNFSRANTGLIVRDGGTPRLEITDVRFAPIAIMLGGTLDVRITVRNTGTAPIKSWGPAPGHVYTAPQENFASIRDPNDPGKPAFFERPGVWRVGVTWQNAPSTFPLRWGLFPPQRKADGSEDWDGRRLEPGESATVEGQIRVFITEDSRQVRFSAGVVQEGVGFPSGLVGEQLVQVGH